ncbi:MAG: TolB-like protein/Tfp pilus assembly protein PilF [Lysobacterales bacterium]|jgi:TolB-like protein/Tfp pilus assembly protein PilF
MSFFEELRRRNVFKVGIAYLVGAWLLMQFSDILLDNMDAPSWVLNAIMLVLFIGFLITLFVAWAFEMTPDGVKREADVDRSQSVTPQTGKKLNSAIFIMMALAIAYLLFDKFTGSEPFSQDVAQQTSGSVEEKRALTPEITTPDERQSIAVLPFENRSNREEDQFFTDGIHDDLLTTIARIGSMKVISRTSVMEYKNTTKKIPEIAKELGVANILEGGIQRSGDQVRINVQLIDAQTDEHLWAEIFDRELTAKNLFAIQSEISQKIANALETTLSPEETARINTMPTQNLEAYDAYMRGKQLMSTRATSKLEEATREFRHAVELDPNFALAWVGIADSHALLASYGSFNAKESLAIQQDAINHALEIDPLLGEAHVSQGMTYSDRGEFEAMEISFRKGIELSPNYATAYHWYASRLNGLSRVQEAVDLSRKAAELDPRSAIIGSNLAVQYSILGLFSRAEQQYKKVIDLNPGFPQGYQSLGQFYAFSLGRFDRAIEYTRTAQKMDPGSLFAPLTLAVYSLELGDQAAANRYRQMVAEISEQDWRLGWTDMMINQAQSNADGVREAWNWTKNKAPNIPFVFQFSALLQLANGDPNATRKIYLDAEPDWAEPKAWGRLMDADPSQACLVSWVFTRTGDEAQGAALLDQTLKFIETLPGLIEHVDGWNPQFCYLIAGDTEKALNTIESQLAHNHLIWWKTYDQLPMYEQIRFEPRYQAAMVERDRRIAEQRDAVEQMNLGKGP